MNTSTMTFDQQSVYRERLEQAKRTMEGLIDQPHTNIFDISVFAVRSGNHIIGCIAGLCGLDPWFQEQGLITQVASGITSSVGSVSVSPRDFFGTDIPFFITGYEQGKPITVEDAIRALERAIAQFSCHPSEGIGQKQCWPGHEHISVVSPSPAGFTILLDDDTGELAVFNESGAEVQWTDEQWEDYLSDSFTTDHDDGVP
jgi:hypothetical protein